MRDRVRVLLLWPGGLFGGGANFGVPQLLGMARLLETQADAVVDVVDLDMERAFGAVDLGRICDKAYDLVGISCYSSFDYLKVLAIGERVRSLLPRAWLVTGGYHPSARPNDFTGGDSPFDFVVVGDGERSMVRLALALATGKRPLNRVIGPDSVEDPSALVPYRWELLSRYRPIARKVASQAEVYLSRGCPYDCAFCMERAKRDVSWRALEPGAAVEELRRLDAFLDLSGWTVFVADALFGMKRSWRRAFLEELARRPTRALRTWLLIRIDLIEREDLELMARANASPGFGLESGDPSQIRRIRKTGKLEGYLDKMITISEWCRELDVPFGANIIVGHPGETETTLRTSAAYMRRLFLGSSGTHGFLSVDPFRLYPGSPIDEDREIWERETGFKAHRYPWWYDGDQDFLARWVDPSRDLDFRRALTLRADLFDPIVHGIERNFAYRGPAREYFMRAVREQVAFTRPQSTLHTLSSWHLWRSLAEAGPRSAPVNVSSDDELSSVARELRKRAIAHFSTSPSIRDVLERVPREQFVRLEDLERSANDEALPLTVDGRSTISAMHAYAYAYRALELAPGDHFVDLGGGSGYGAAVAAELVGPSGSVLTIDLVPELCVRARRLLARYENVRVVEADAHDTKIWAGARKVSCGFSLGELPASWASALAEGGQLVAPIGTRDAQVLTIFRKRGGVVTGTPLLRVVYVADRSAARFEVEPERASTVD